MSNPVSDRLRRADKTERRAVRRRLASEGLPPAEVERQVEALRLAQLAARAAVRLSAGMAGPERVEAYWREQAERFPDRGFRPVPPDRLLTGAARAQGVAAKAVRRRSAVTLYEYRREEGIRASADAEG